MKFYFIFSFSIFLSFLSHAQTEQPKNYIKIAPVGLINKVKIQYERDLKGRLSVGSFLTSTYPQTRNPGSNYGIGWFPRIVIEPFFRFYNRDSGSSKFFLQVKGIVGYNYPKLYYYQNGFAVGSHWDIQGDLTSQEVFRFMSYGAGITGGYKVLFGKRFGMEMSLGIKYVSLPKKISEKTVVFLGENSLIQSQTSSIWYKYGPGSFFEGNFSLFYAF